MTFAGGMTTETGLSENDTRVGQCASVGKFGPNGLAVEILNFQRPPRGKSTAQERFLQRSK